MLRTAASLAGITAVFALVLYLSYGSGGSGDSAATATPAPSEAVAAPTRTPNPTLTPPAVPSPRPSYLLGDLRGTSVIPLRQGEPIEFPADVALIIETGCWQCDGPTTGLDRVYRDPSGKTRRETLVSAEMLGLADNQGTPPVILGFDALDDASWIVVAFCTAGDCGWLGIPDIDARTTFFESTDGGVTWGELAELEGTYAIETMVPPTAGRERDVVIQGPLHPDLAPSGSLYYYLGTREPVQSPAEAWVDPYPRVAPSGEIIWQTEDNRLVTSSGELFLFAGSNFRSTGDFVADSKGTRWGIPWIFDSGNQPSPHLLTLTDVNGTVIRTLESQNYVEWGVGSGNLVYGNAELDRAILGDVGLSDPVSAFFPVQISLSSASFGPILDPFAAKQDSYGRNRVVAVQSGSFARVVNTDGSCLNMRDTPSLGGRVVECLPTACCYETADTTPSTTTSSGRWFMRPTAAKVGPRRSTSITCPSGCRSSSPALRPAL